MVKQYKSTMQAYSHQMGLQLLIRSSAQGSFFKINKTCQTALLQSIVLSGTGQSLHCSGETDWIPERITCSGNISTTDKSHLSKRI